MGINYIEGTGARRIESRRDVNLKQYSIEEPGSEGKRTSPWVAETSPVEFPERYIVGYNLNPMNGWPVPVSDGP